MRIDERLADTLGLTATRGRELVRELYGAVPSPEIAVGIAMSAYTEWARAARNNTPLSLILLDVDFFKFFNDSYGHQAGDDALRAVASTLKTCLRRPADLVARYGGEEFVCLIHVADEQQLLAAGERIRAAVAEKPILSKPDPLHVQVSIGAAMRRRGEEGNALFARSDKALYKAKNAGRNLVMLDAMASSPMTADVNIASAL